MAEFQDPWFLDKYKQRRHDPVFTTLEVLRHQQQDRLERLALYRILYGDDECRGYASPVVQAAMSSRAGRTQFSENLIRSVIDTVCAKIGKNSPKPFIVSNGGDGQLRRKAKNLNKFVLGKIDSLQVSNRLRSILRDAAIVGTGALKTLVDYQSNDLALERTDIATLFVDPSECQFGQQPTQMFQAIPANKRLMMDLYPQLAAQIKQAKEPSYATYAHRKAKPMLEAQVELIEAWKLPDAPDKPGRHVICASNCTLVDEEWDDCKLPFVFIHYNEPVSGFWGTGLAQMLMEVQYRVNYTLLQIQENIRLCGKPTWLIDQRANVTQSHIRNVIGNQLLYKQFAPQLVNFQTTNPETFQWLNDQRTRAYAIPGVSEQSANSTRPTAQLSGIAIDSMNDIESERFIMFGKAYEQAALDVCEAIIDLTKREYEKGDDDVKSAMFRSTFSRSWELSEIKWSEVDLKRDQYNLSVFPISSLPQSVAGRQQQIQDYMQQGMIPADIGRELLDFPDYSRWADLQAVGRDNAERFVEDVLYDGIDPVVEKYHDVNYMLTYCQQLYNQQQLIDADETKLERLRQLMDQCQELIDQNPPPQAAAPAAPQSQGAPTPNQ